MWPLLKFLITKQSGGVRVFRALVAGAAVLTALGKSPSNVVEWSAIVAAILSGLVTQQPESTPQADP